MEKVALIINTASYERVVLALSLAAASAAMAKKVSLFFSYGGLFRLRKGHVDVVAEETPVWVRQQFKMANEEGRISEMIRDIKELGGAIYACPAAMVFHNLSQHELIPEVDRVRGIVDFLREEAEGARLIYV